MFEAIVSKFTSLIRCAIRSVGAATRRTPWLVPIASLAFFFVL